MRRRQHPKHPIHPTQTQVGNGGEGMTAAMEETHNEGKHTMAALDERTKDRAAAMHGEANETERRGMVRVVKVRKGVRKREGRTAVGCGAHGSGKG